MNPVLFVLPFIPALLCWLLIKFFIKFLFRPVEPVKILGITFHGFLPRYKESLALSFAHEISKELLSENFLQQKLATPDMLEKAMPVIETHIDDFLTHKLKEELPMIAMFIGEKTISQLRTLFLKELRELFPSVMSQFIGDLSHSEELKQELVVKLRHVQVETIEAKFYEAYRKEINKVELVFALTGFIAGLAELILIIIVLK